MIAESTTFGASFIALIALVAFLAIVWKAVQE